MAKIKSALDKLDPDCWPCRGGAECMTYMDTSRLEAIIGWCENNDRRDNRLLESRQCRWIRKQLNRSWGWKRLVKRRRDCYEAMDTLERFEREQSITLTY